MCLSTTSICKWIAIFVGTCVYLWYYHGWLDCPSSKSCNDEQATSIQFLVPIQTIYAPEMIQKNQLLSMPIMMMMMTTTMTMTRILLRTPSRLALVKGIATICSNPTTSSVQYDVQPPHYINDTPLFTTSLVLEFIGTLWKDNTL
jgi:hypothetical protein